MLAVCAVAVAQQDLSHVDQLLEQAKALRAADPKAARQKLTEALDCIDRVDAGFGDEKAMQARWQCGGCAWLFDNALGNRAWQGVVSYYDKAGPGVLTDPEQLRFYQQARGFLAAIHEMEQRFDDAIALRTTIVTTWEKAKEDVEAAFARAELGQAQVRGGYESGLRGLVEMEKACAQLEKGHAGSHELAKVAQLFANALVDMGQDLDARVLALQEKALAIYAKTPPGEQDIGLLINLKWETANTLQKHLRLLEARKLAQEAFTEAEETFGKDKQETFWPRAFYAGVLKSMGDSKDAFELMEQNVKLCVANCRPQSLDLMMAWNSYGHALMVGGQYEEAIAAFENGLKAVDPAERTPLALSNLGLMYDNLGQCYADGNRDTERTKEAVKLLEEALAKAPPGNVRAQIQGGLGMVLQRSGEFEKAAEQFALSVPHVVEIGGNYYQATNYLRRQALTLAALGRGRETDLQKCLENMLDVARRAQQECHMLPGRPSYELATIADRAAQQVLALADRTPQKAQFERRAFEALESLRGIELRVTNLATRLASQPGAGAIAEQLRKVWAARAHLARLTTLGEGTSTQILEGARKRDQIEFEAMLKALKGTKLPVVEVTIDAIAKSLPKDAAAVAFRVVSLVVPDEKDKGREAPRQEFEAHVVTRVGDKGKFERIPLGEPEKIRRACDQWLAAIVNGEERGRAPGASTKGPDPVDELDRLVMAKLNGKLGGAKVLVVCLDDHLHKVPFELLPGAKNLDVRYAVSFADLLTSAPPPSGTPSLFVVGGLDFDARPDAKTGDATPLRPDVDAGHSAAKLRGAAPVWSSEESRVTRHPFDPLDGSKTEAEKIAATFTEKFKKPCAAAMGGAVSRESFLASAQSVQFLHLATHGYFLQSQDDAPSARHQSVQTYAPMSLCGLALSGANQTGKDGFLGVVTGEELAALDLSACKLAVLSACETYLGEARSGHGLASLQGALHASGARIVIATRWKVPDEAASTLMQSFYRRLWVDGHRPRKALKMAMDQLEGKAGSKAIRNWGGFVLTGDLKD